MLTTAALAAAYSRFAGWVRAGGWKALVLASLCALSAFVAFRVVSAHYQTKALTEAVADAQANVGLLDHARKADSRASTGLAKAKARINQNERIASDKLDAALAANKDWANQPVPSAVLDSLRD